MHVQVARQIGELDERRQAALAGGFDLAPVLAQLWRDPGQAERSVRRLLRFSGKTLLAMEQAVFVAFPAARDCQIAQRDVVRLGTGELQQCGAGAGAGPGHHAQVRLNAAREHARGACASDPDSLPDSRELREMGTHGLAVLGDCELVDVANHIAGAPQASGNHDLVHFWCGTRQLGKTLRPGAGVGEPAAPDLGELVLDCLDEALLAPRAEAADRADAVVPGGAQQLRQGLHVQLLVERARLLGAQTGKLQQVHDRQRDLAPQLLEHDAVTGAHDLLELGGEISADAGLFRQRLACRDQGA